MGDETIEIDRTFLRRLLALLAGYRNHLQGERGEDLREDSNLRDVIVRLRRELIASWMQTDGISYPSMLEMQGVADTTPTEGET